MKNREEHVMVPVEWKGGAVPIDAGIAPLIQELWKAGLFTMNSCEENRPGWMWIEFLDVNAAEGFLDIVARYEDHMDSLYNRIRQAWSPTEGELQGEWEYDAHPSDWAVEETEVEDGYIEECCDGPSQFTFSLSIRFPRSDFPVLLERMREYNNRKDEATMGVAGVEGISSVSTLTGERLICDV